MVTPSLPSQSFCDSRVMPVKSRTKIVTPRYESTVGDGCCHRCGCEKLRQSSENLNKLNARMGKPPGSKGTVIIRNAESVEQPIKDADRENTKKQQNVPARYKHKTVPERTRREA